MKSRVRNSKNPLTVTHASTLAVACLLGMGFGGGRHALEAQLTGPEAAAMEVVDRLFDGMRERDRSKLESVFHESARLMSAGEREGVPAVSETPIAGFIESIVTSEGAILDERLYDPKVRVDGNLASIWVAYDFYRGPDFSHCGFDAFQLAMTPDGWKIIQITDTRRREGCPDRG